MKKKVAKDLHSFSGSKKFLYKCEKNLIQSFMCL